MSTYHVSRNGHKLGVYTEDETREYFSQGRIGPDDMVWRDGMAEWMRASEVFGPPTHPSHVDTAPPPLPSTEPRVAAARAVHGAPAAVPPPPKLHWALVLLFGVVTLGIFFVVWIFIQAAWVRRINPASNATTLFTVYLVLALLGEIVAGASAKDSAGAATGGLLWIAASIVSIFGFFSMRRSMLNYFNAADPGSLRLSGVMTFFFNVFYLQYHMARIAGWKGPGRLPPQ